jgi:DNA-binding NtrC family response regulator
MRILAVDDDRVSLTLLLDALRRGCPDDDLVAAGSGEEARELLATQPIDLVITDLVMPGVSGLDLLHETGFLRPDAEVIVVTAQSSVETAAEAMRRGARDYLSKPVDPDLVREKVENIRDMLAARAEADQCRYAKETMEAGVARTIATLERCLAEKEEQLRVAAELVENASSPAECIEALRTHLLAANAQEI